MRADGLMKTVAATAVVAASFVAGYHAATLNYERDIAELKESYAQSERDTMRRAEELRHEQEAKFLSELEAVKRDAADRSADAERVRKQFNELKSRRSATLEQCNRRAARCEQLLSEAYELAGECEGLLRDRDARLRSLK